MKVLQELAKRIELKHGFLIAIEGIDGAGKTTQTTLLFERLRKKGYSVICFHEPTNGQWGEKIRELAKNGRGKVSAEDEMNLFYQDRIEDVENNIRPALKEKKIVIMDRYYFSNIAYQSARGLDPNRIERLNEKVAPLPNVLIVLDVTPEVALKRIREKRNGKPNHFERITHLQRVREIFLSRFSKRIYAHIIDGDDKHTETSINDKIWTIVLSLLEKAQES